MAEAIGAWQGQYGSAGAVIGATAPEELATLLAIHSRNPVPVLIPGVGSQGGNASEVRTVIRDSGYPPELIRVNVSRNIISPWGPDAEIPSDWRRRIGGGFRALHEDLRWT